MRRSVQSEIHEYVGVEEHNHRYFAASALYRSSLLLEARNLPRHFPEKDNRSVELISLRAVSMSRERDTV